MISFESTKRIYLIILSLFVLLQFSCKKDKLLDPEPIEHHVPAELEITNAVALSMEYEIITASYVTPVNPADKENITEAEEFLGRPEFEGRKVMQLVNKDGTIDANIDVMNLEGMPDYPKNRIGGAMVPSDQQTKRIEVRGGQYTHYNEAGDVLSTHYQDQASTAFYTRILEDFKEKVMLAEDEMDLLLYAFEDMGFVVSQNSSDPTLEELVYTFPDGSMTKLYIDKTLQEIVARRQYDENGSLEFASDFIHKTIDSEEEPELVFHRIATFYDSPFSGVKMAIMRVSEIRNLNIQTHL